MLEVGFIVSVFVAGIIMFLAPCTLPLVPAYLAFISGVSPHIPEDPVLQKQFRRAIVRNGIAFMAGFSCVFIVLGVLIGFFGMYLSPYRSILAQGGGFLIILFGLMMLGILRVPHLGEARRFALPGFFTPGRVESSFVVGASFAFGWTPCVGPILASVLLLASTVGTAAQGALLLAVFSLGLGIPFILSAVLYSTTQRLVAATERFSRITTYVGGVFLIVLGVLLATEQFGLTVEIGYWLFEFLNYDEILNYL